jgi:uncharacterized membrane protein YhaH (DUF805 family)
VTVAHPTLAQRVRRLPAYWFAFRLPVRRFEYAVSGLFLAAIKFATDNLLYESATGRTWSWTSYMHPSFTLRFPGASGSLIWVVWALALWTLPFLWIGASMTVRRCLDAGVSPKWIVLFFVPGINYALMALLCFLPSRESTGSDDGRTDAVAQAHSRTRIVVSAVGTGACAGLAMMILSVWVLHLYGLALFLGAPFVMGALCAHGLSRGGHCTTLQLFLATQLMLLVAALALIMFAFEGVLCLVMAYPIATGLVLLGAVIWQTAAEARWPDHYSKAGAFLGLPLLLLLDRAHETPPLREVVTTIEVDVPPGLVWRHVIEFPPLDPPREALFRLGIAAPSGARIEGTGIGAVRHCEFSTGEFVEPITAWDEPARLAFDVAAQPPPMRELSPYREVHAPHLLDGLVSKRGEFRLEPLPGGRTRLAGHTWYTLDLWPQAYWTVWSDAIIHRIHRRVLDHVKRLAEEDVRR